LKISLPNYSVWILELFLCAQAPGSKGFSYKPSCSGSLWCW